ncbi:hypothetical protein V1477_013439 [Vespula maculifrons]|uniref:Uncharacterized protein n=1 Tax=Vespula maculifrons TaxID=7453 RepID=A0ABD2BQH9_VESMC
MESCGRQNSEAEEKEEKEEEEEEGWRASELANGNSCSPTSDVSIDHTYSIDHAHLPVGGSGKEPGLVVKTALASATVVETIVGGGGDGGGGGGCAAAAAAAVAGDDGGDRRDKRNRDNRFLCSSDTERAWHMPHCVEMHDRKGI